MSKDKQAWRVTWEQVITSRNREEAAQQAFENLQRPSTATIFDVTQIVDSRSDEYPKTVSVDLDAEYQLKPYVLKERFPDDKTMLEHVVENDRLHVALPLDLYIAVRSSEEGFLDYLEDRVMPEETVYTLVDYDYHVIGTTADRNVLLAITGTITEL